MTFYISDLFNKVYEIADTNFDDWPTEANNLTEHSYKSMQQGKILAAIIAGEYFDSWLTEITHRFVKNIRGLSLNLNPSANVLQENFNRIKADKIINGNEIKADPIAKEHLAKSLKVYFGEKVSFDQISVASFDVSQINLASLFGSGSFNNSIDMLLGVDNKVKDAKKISLGEQSLNIPFYNRPFMGLLYLAMLSRQLYVVSFSDDYMTLAYDDSDEYIKIAPIKTEDIFETITEFNKNYGDSVKMSDEMFIFTVTSLIESLRQIFYTQAYDAYSKLYIENLHRSGVDHINKINAEMLDKIKKAEGTSNGFGWS